MPKIIHYRKNCIGCNSCVEINPENWIICKKDGKSLLIKGKETKKNEIYQKEINEIEKESVISLVNVCPMNIIKIED